MPELYDALIVVATLAVREGVAWLSRWLRRRR